MSSSSSAAAASQKHEHKSASPAVLQPVSDRVNFSREEVRIGSYWKEIHAFETSLARSAGKPVWTFYDGPPFATGLPHYGHILAGTIKDTVTRYASQTGHYVERRFGWDTHGLPVEYEIDQKLGIKSKDDVMKMGVAAYNAECRAIVLRYTREWESTVLRMGRWIDFRHDYKTMDPSFMESVWWVFGQLYEKGLIYRGFKVMPYSTVCTTPLSNFEAGLNYKDVKDPAVVVAFPVTATTSTTATDTANTFLLAWTTTPWTLPSNLALAVHPTLTYLRVKDRETQRIYVLAEARLEEVYPPKKKPAAAAGAAAPAADYEVLQKYSGADLAGWRYRPLFPYFASEAEKGAFRVLTADYVTSDSGTGIVHQAPAFGEDDYRVCADAGIIRRGEEIICPVDANGCFTAEVTHFKGRYVKEADKDIARHLKQEGLIIKQVRQNRSQRFQSLSNIPACDAPIFFPITDFVDYVVVWVFYCFRLLLPSRCSGNHRSLVPLLLAQRQSSHLQSSSVVVRTCRKDQGATDCE